MGLPLLLVFGCESKKSRTQSEGRSREQQSKPEIVADDLIYLEEMARNPESPQPILIAMHGFGSNERDPLGWATSLSERFFVVSIRAPLDLGNDRYAWFGRGIPDNKRVEAHADKVIKVIEGLPRTAFSQGSGSDESVKSPVFVTGFSQGARMAIEVGKRAKPGLIQGVLAFSPSLFESQGLSVPTLIGHGRRDKVVPFNRIEDRSLRLIELGSSVTFIPFDAGHTISPSLFGEAQHWTETILNRKPNE